MQRPTAIISYSHDSDEHDGQVLQLSERLRDHGVDCEIEAYQVSPEEKWPGWMRRQLQERDFCIVVCTETYSRRFAGNEAPRTGKGATQEGRLLRQILYEDEKNACIIPVVFDPADVKHIPLELKNVTRYDLSTDDGYKMLHRALTDQPLVERGLQGPMHRHFPLRAQDEREAADDSGCRFDAPATSERTRTREGHEEPAHRWPDWRAKMEVERRDYMASTNWNDRNNRSDSSWAGWCGKDYITTELPTMPRIPKSDYTINETAENGTRGDGQTNSGQEMPPTIVTTAPGVVERQPDRSPLRQRLADQGQDKGRTDEEAQRQTEERVREQQKLKEANRIAEMEKQERLKLQREMEELRRAQEQEQEGAPAKEQAASNDVLDTLEVGTRRERKIILAGGFSGVQANHRVEIVIEPPMAETHDYKWEIDGCPNVILGGTAGPRFRFVTGDKGTCIIRLSSTCKAFPIGTLGCVSDVWRRPYRLPIMGPVRN